MNKMFIVLKNELIRYFISPLAYVYLLAFLLLNGSFAIYFGDFFNRGQADLLSMFSFQPWLYLLFIPGISSSFIMLLFNFYSYTYTIIHDHPLLNIVPIVITVLCCLAGVILNVLLVSFLLKKYPMHFYNLSAGIISGAFITILLSASPSL